MRSKLAWLSLVLVAQAVLVACGQTPKQFSFIALGTEVRVTVYSGQDVSDSIRQLEQHFLDRGRDWYPWSDGELARLNAALQEDRLPMRVSGELAQLLRRAAEIEFLSDGAFNAGIGKLSLAWGFDDIANTPDATPDQDEISQLIRNNPGLQTLRWQDDTVIAAGQGVAIDLGGIAKGALLQESRQQLASAGIRNAIVSIGGDLLVLGQAGRRPVRIGIQSPFSNHAIGSLDVADGETVVTSGNYERFFEIDGRRYNHVLDPATGYPVRHTVAVTVVHEDPVLADAAATALMVGGPDAFKRLTERLGIQTALLIDSSGDLRLTWNMQKRLSSSLGNIT